ncbi:cobalamin biosynthesis protein [Actinoplanes sp. TBRC 11911]|uniref:cobalamin biosynthesis protein n=1 Tax=Actinoplanes sp. TBRC 11911 TaxID=2729386 RepID=UPI00145E8D55|nr:cobalamin biosynthesis protein [Actinoplanes sp. TBRC 11911]NMO55472.1 cobalamin biosynthesis protein [Actinoplanes sp. TBRC 11911]
MAVAVAVVRVLGWEDRGVFVVGVGARRGVSVGDLRSAVDTVLREAGLVDADVRILATIERRAAERGVREMAREKGWELVPLDAVELGRQDVPHPSATVHAAVGTASVAEAAALAAAGSGSRLTVPKRVFPGVTVAVAAMR